MNRMPVQKIQKLDNRLRDWRARRRSALVFVAAVGLTAVPLGALFGSWLLQIIAGKAITFRDCLEICIIVALPMFLFMPSALTGPRPTAEDVEEDRALRRAAGLPDDIED